jgi:hypothetical protein
MSGWDIDREELLKKRQWLMGVESGGRRRRRRRRRERERERVRE